MIKNILTPIVTPYHQKLKDKAYKAEERRKIKQVKELSIEDELKARMSMTLIAQSIELMNDSFDDLLEIGLFNDKSGFAQLRNEYLKLQKFFIESKQKTEAEELERIQHQKSFEILMRNISQYNPKQMSLIIEYSNNLKHKK